MSTVFVYSHHFLNALEIFIMIYIREFVFIAVQNLSTFQNG